VSGKSDIYLYGRLMFSLAWCCIREAGFRRLLHLSFLVNILVIKLCPYTRSFPTRRLMRGGVGFDEGWRVVTRARRVDQR